MSAALPIGIESTLVDVRERLARLEEAREHAHDRVVLAVRAIEQRLTQALDGDILRGLPVIALPKFRAAAVVPASCRYGVATHVPHDGRELLVVSNRGHLAMVRREGGELVCRACLDLDIRIEDLTDVARTVALVAERHVERCDRTAARWAEFGALAARLHSIL
jgi:hypothetical protein